jgi:WD40 repeat protein
MFLTASDDRTARLWDAASSTPIGLPLPHSDSVTDLAFSPDGKSFLTGSHDKTARLWDIPDRQAAEIILRHANSEINDLAFSTDGKLLAVASEFIKPLSGYGETDVEKGFPVGRVHFWDRVTGKRLGELTFNEGRVLKMAFSPDSAALATYSRFADSRRAGGLVQLVDVATRKTMGEPLEFNELGVSDLAFGPEGKTLATTDGVHIRADGTSNWVKRAVRTWDLATRKIIRETVETDWGLFSPDRKRKLVPGWDNTVVIIGPGDEKGQVQHQDSVASAAFSANGAFLLTGAYDHTARLWHVPTLKPVGPAIKHQKIVRAVAFSRDGESIMTGSEDGIVRVGLVPKGPSKNYVQLYSGACPDYAAGPKAKLEAVLGWPLSPLKAIWSASAFGCSRSPEDAWTGCNSAS